MPGTEATNTAKVPDNATLPDLPLEIRGLKYFQKLLPLFQPLHHVGCERDTAHRRKLHYDEYAALVLLYLFNSGIDGMRGLQHALSVPKVAQTLGVERFSLGSFSEAPAVFDPELLKPIIAELAREARALPPDPRLADLPHALTLVDGTMLAALPKLVQAAALGTRYARGRDGKDRYAWRLHTQLELTLPSPRRIDVTGACKSGQNRETQVMRQGLEGGRCYATDAGYVDYGLFDEIVEIGSSYVCRIREDSVFEVREERELSTEALAAGIVRDAIVYPGGVNAPERKHPVRILFIQVTPRSVRTRKAEGVKVMGSRRSDLLVIATSLLDLPAELVALIYRKRYSIELFFRFLKSLLGMRHLLSQREAGVEIQSYCAIIACLLLNLWTGKRPTKRMVEMIGWYLMGLASEEDVLNFLSKPDHTGVKQRAKDELWKKLGVN